MRYGRSGLRLFAAQHHHSGDEQKIKNKIGGNDVLEQLRVDIPVRDEAGR